MFKEFKIGDVFYKIDTPKIKAKANDFPTEYSEKYCVPLLTAGAENQGLNRYAKISDCPLLINNAISVSANGANSGICFYQPHDFAVLQDAYAVKVNGREIDGVEEGLYLTGALNKAVRDNHDWVNKAGWNHIKDDSIELPVIENSNPDHEYTVDDIDWQYMRDRITELERDRITELDAYLQATGLNDYELTEDDKKILSFSAKRASDEARTVEDDSEDEVRFDLFRVDEIFEVVGTKSLDAGAVEFKDNGINFVGRTYENNGVQGKIDKQDYEPNNANTITATVIGNYKYVKYQEEPYYCSQNINKLTLLDKFNYTLNRLSADYLIALIRKFVEQYNGQQGGYKLPELKGYKMLLPIKSDGTPDFDYMERYIRAMEKVVIADVVKYKDKVIEETKKVVNDRYKEEQ